MPTCLPTLLALPAEGEEGEGGDEAAAAVAAVLNGAVALVVYRNAIAAFPGSVPFRAKFLEMLAPLQFPGRASLEVGALGALGAGRRPASARAAAPVGAPCPSACTHTVPCHPCFRAFPTSTAVRRPALPPSAQEAIYDSVAADFGGSPEAWDLRARRHTLGLPPGAPAATRAAAVRAAVGVYEQGLAAVRTPEMAALLLAFLQQQAAALDAATQGGASGEEARQWREAAEWLRQRTQEAFEEAAADGLLTEALRLDGIAFFLHCGDAHAAAAAARAGTHALPQSAALWQQLLALEAVLAAEHLGGGASAEQQQGGSSSDESSDEEELPLAPAAGAASLAAAAAAATRHSGGAAQRRLEETALAALRAVPAAEAVPVWLAAIELLCGGGCSLQALAQELVQAAMRQAKGPVEVRRDGGRLRLVALGCPAAADRIEGPALLSAQTDWVPCCTHLHRLQGGLGAVAAALLAALHRAGGVEAARALYRALLPLPPPGGDFFRALLRLEVEQAAAAAGGTGGPPGGAKASPAAPLSGKQLGELFEAAVDAYGVEDAQLWLQYAEWRASAGGAAADGAAAVYWKARKALRQPEAFEAAYHLRFKLQPGATA